MNHAISDINALRNIILDSQHLRTKSTDSIARIVSDICGLQYDPNPTIHLNQYMMLWNRKKDFVAEQLDIAAYQTFQVTETWTFKRNLYFVPRTEYALYRHAAKSIVRWGESDEIWLNRWATPEVLTEEKVLKEQLSNCEGLTLTQIWECLNLSHEWHKFRREHDPDFDLPIFRAFYRMCRRGDFLTCGRNPGTFQEPVYILKEKIGFPDWMNEPIDETQAIQYVVEKMIASFGVTDPIHISHISGYKTADLEPIFHELEAEERIVQLPYKIARRQYYIHTSALHRMQKNLAVPSGEVRLISPMDTIVRDKVWLETFFDYSFTFEYFKKKGMKWPLSILVGNQFVGYVDCKMNWRNDEFVIKERNIFHPDYRNCHAIDHAIESLAEFHGAKSLKDQSQLSG